MVRLHRIHTVDTYEHRFIERLLTSAFPKEEYREMSEFRKITISKHIFHNNLVFDGDTLVGFITYWDLGQFFFIEHFATLPEMRNKGYGKEVLQYLQSHLHAPIVLEVERPIEETAKLRIGFYERHGFSLWKNEYLQPPYRFGDEFLSLFLMVYGDLDENSDFNSVKDIIYKEVYNYGDLTKTT